MMREAAPPAPGKGPPQAATMAATTRRGINGRGTAGGVHRRSALVIGATLLLAGRGGGAQAAGAAPVLPAPHMSSRGCKSLHAAAELFAERRLREAEAVLTEMVSASCEEDGGGIEAGALKLLGDVRLEQGR